VKDSARLALLKRLIVALWRVEFWLRRGWARLRGRRRWQLVGSCRQCGRCCVEPSIAGGLLTWFLPPVRSFFLAWQARINGFVLHACDEETRSFSFTCTHYDPATKRCDSYGSRPAMCRDYPRLLLEQPWPVLFDECGFRVRLLRSEGLRAQIDATSLSDAAKAELRRKMRLE
jgi:uncharacterized protein